MNDAFLHRLRRDPPPQFAARLRTRLSEQRPVKRSSWFAGALRQWPLAAAVLVGGSAFAIAWLSLQLAPAPATQTPAGEAVASAPRNEGARGVSPRRLEPAPSSSSTATERERLAVREATGASSTAAVVASQQPMRSDEPAGARGAPTAQPASAATAQAFTVMTPESLRRITAALVNQGRYWSGGLPMRIQTAATPLAFERLCGQETTRPYLVIADRRMSEAEMQVCGRSGGGQLVELKLGYQAIVISAGPTADEMSLTPHDVYLALAREIPDPADPDRFIANPHVQWDHVNPVLPPARITVFGPAKGSLARQQFESLILEPGCRQSAAMRQLSRSDPGAFAHRCRMVREDGVYVEATEVDTLITQQLWAEPRALAVLSYAFYQRHRQHLRGSSLAGPEPSLESFAAGVYPAAQSIHLYADQARIQRTSGQMFLKFAISDHTVGQRGSLTYEGLIPRSDDEGEKHRLEPLLKF